MIELHTWGTPNGRKVSIMLEECGLPYSVHKIDISKGEQFKPEFLRISPNNRIPAIVDPDGPGGKPLSLFESGAILIYLAEKTAKFLPKDPVQKYKTLEWLMWQMGGVGPMFGQAHHFLRPARCAARLARAAQPRCRNRPVFRSRQAGRWRGERRGVGGLPRRGGDAALSRWSERAECRGSVARAFRRSSRARAQQAPGRGRVQCARAPRQGRRDRHGLQPALWPAWR